MLEHLFLFIASLIANTFSALTGGGAGLLQLPILLFLGLNFGTALATHKVATIALGVGATLRHLKEDALERRCVFCILATGLPGVVIGAAVILQVPDVWARFLLGLLTIGLAIYSFFKKTLGQTAQPNHREGLGLLIGGVGLFLIGFLNGSLTSGTGLFVTLWLVRWFGADYKQAVAYTLVLVGLFWNGTGAFALGMLGDIRWDWLPALLLGSVIGGYMGAHWAIAAGNRGIKIAFEVVTLLVGIKLLSDAYVMAS